MLLRLHRLIKSGLRRDLRVDHEPVKCRQIRLVEISEALLHVHVSVQEDIAVGRMIVSRVEVKESLVGQVRNIDRISA